MSEAALPAPTELVVFLVPLRRRHLRSVMRIEAQVYPRPWSLPLFLSELSLRTTRHYVAARVGAAVAGYAGIMFSGDDAHVTNVAVDPAWQRRQVATRMLLHQARFALARGAHHLTLEVRVSNLGAQHLYRRFGFLPAGVRKNYYADTGEDALIMWAHDIGTEEYRRRLEEIERAIPGSTVDEAQEWVAK
ncbi:MAG: ribosomal protein S18-alanine N-acetyltransferase [Acidimicrobiales bacterium]